MMARRNGPGFNLFENRGYTPKLIPNLEPRGKCTHTGCPPPSSGKRGILVDLVSNTNNLERRGRFTQTRSPASNSGRRRQLKRLHSGRRRQLKRLHSGRRRQLKRLHSGKRRPVRRLHSLANQWDGRSAQVKPIKETFCDEHVNTDYISPPQVSLRLSTQVSPRLPPKDLHDDLPSTNPPQRNLWDDLSPQVSPETLHVAFAFKRSGDRHFTDAFKTNRSCDRHYTDAFKGLDLF